jgi:hypothetical protein
MPQLGAGQQQQQQQHGSTKSIVTSSPFWKHVSALLDCLASVGTAAVNTTTAANQHPHAA